MHEESLHLGWHFRWYQEWESVWLYDVSTRWATMLRGNESSCVYHRPEFVRIWSETLGADCVPLIGFCRHESGHVVLLPWIVARHRGRFVERRVVEYAGRELSGYQNPLFVRTSGASLDWDDFWQAVALATAGDCDQGLMRNVSALCAPSWGREVPEATPVLDLAGVASPETLLARCSGNHRGDLRRRIRRLEEHGELELHVASSEDAADVASDLREGFLVQHAVLCREKGYSDPFRQPEAASFLAGLFDRGLRDGWAFYGRLRLGGETLAWILGLIHGEEFYWWRPAYHSAWKRFSPGKVLLALTLYHGLTAGWTKVHFHAGDQPYKLAWKPDLAPMSGVSWYPPGVRSSSLAWYDRIVGSR